jgi:hypothetical protein
MSTAYTPEHGSTPWLILQNDTIGELCHQSFWRGSVQIYDEKNHRAQRSKPSRIQSGNSVREWRTSMMKTSTAHAPEHRSTP